MRCLLYLLMLKKFQSEIKIMAKKKFYAVKKGKRTGIFPTWEECKASVDGYPGAQYRGFATKSEATAYLNGTENFAHGAQTSLTGAGNNEAGEYVPLSAAQSYAAAEEYESGTRCLPGQVTAYVDGSFDVKIGKYSFGCVMLTPEGEIVRESGNGDNPQSLALRNVTGEMLGAMFAVKWSAVNGYSAVEICYDYMGIEMWATGGWKAKNDLTQKYAAFMRENAKRIRITYRKIAAHTGDKYNEEADKLAKAALTEGNGIPKITRRTS